MEIWVVGVFIFCFHFSFAQMPGFVSVDCGGTQQFTDELGLQWTPDEQFKFGETTKISTPQIKKQYTTLRHFPNIDNRKYCYTLNVTSRTRYLLRATFLYGNFDNKTVYPKFDVSIGSTPWSTIVITDSNTIQVIELILLATDPTISVCLSNATTGQPFISTLELRELNGSLYSTNYENQFYMSVSARINFGADSVDPVRYPADPFDRIWESDSVKKPNYLVDVAAGTEKISTKMPIKVDQDERPPEKVMQTAVVGKNGTLSYRLNLDGFPAGGWAFAYFAEIQDLGPNDLRKFRLMLPDAPQLSNVVVNILENAEGKYRLYEPGYDNLSLPFVLSFKFIKTPDSSLGPLLNAMEINKYVKKNDGSLDVDTIASFVSHFSWADWAQEGGDPCLPVPWSWLHCTSDAHPLITIIHLSKKKLSGQIPSELTKLSGLVELWLDGNSLTGPIPDFSGCVNLKIIHLEHNQLTGSVPPSLANLPNLKELHIQDNVLSGKLPSKLVSSNLVLNYSGNAHLQRGSKSCFGRKTGIIIGSTIGAAALLVATLIACIFLKKDKPPNQKLAKPDGLGHTLLSQKVSSAHIFTYSELQEATNDFEENIGWGGYGVAYYGKLKSGREIAVKVLTNYSYQGKREFSNEVTFHSRIHYRNVVQFLGYCQEDGHSILVYEFMHLGTLKQFLNGPLTRERDINWIKRLEIAQDIAKGIEYLHTGCMPAIIHRDLKPSNILVDKKMRAKVSNFSVAEVAEDGASREESIVMGSVGYLDPEYSISRKLSDKSDVYSFGVILLELICGEAIVNERYRLNCEEIGKWAKLHVERGDMKGIMDPSLQNEYKIESMQKIVEKALMCVEPHGYMRPSMSQVIRGIQDAILIQKEAHYSDNNNIQTHSSIQMPPIDLGPTHSSHEQDWDTVEMLAH